MKHMNYLMWYDSMCELEELQMSGTGTSYSQSECNFQPHFNQEHKSCQCYMSKFKTGHFNYL